ncbi:MAG: glycosyltransferase family 2 protein [Clostridia bacterium]|nr:glycosyltransferase family 2 protein [Clostridia bacterium]
MSFRIAQIGYTAPKGSPRNHMPHITDEPTQIDVYAISVPNQTRAGLVRSIDELEHAHEKNPYHAIQIELPYFPEEPQEALSTEYREVISTAIRFADRAKLPYYFHTPVDASPKKLSARLLRQELDIRSLQDQAMGYQVISNSFFWKATKPFRALSDLMKRVMKKSRVLRKVGKGFRYWKRHGLRATLRKLRQTKEMENIVLRKLYSPEELEAQKKAAFSRNIKISILVPLYNTPITFLKEMIDSVTAQTYQNWELCLADGSDAEHGDVETAVMELAQNEPRIKYKRLKKNLGISENTNACIEIATGDYIALFDHDDILHPAALFEVMGAICNKGADFVYTDEATFQSPDIKKIVSVNYKTDFAPDSLRSINYICHLSVFDRTLLDKVGRFRSEFDGSQDHDLIMRLTEYAQNVVHIPKVLYYWRAHSQSVAMDTGAKSYAAEAGKKAVLAAMKRAGDSGTVESSRALASIYRIHYDLQTDGTVSIIIPNKNHLKDLRLCITSILEKTTYPNFEIVIVDNGSDETELFDYYEELKKDARIKICSLDIPFNYSKLNNYAIEQASGEYYLLLNNDIEILTPNWIEEMLMYVQRDDVGAAGAMLYYPDDTVQHAGVIIGIGGIAGHAFKHFARTELGYMGRLCYAQNVSAVTAACMLIKASVYHEVGGLDESFEVAFNDVDLCMKIRRAGYLIVWTPHAEAYHYESKSRGYEDTEEKKQRFNSEINRFWLKWGDFLADGDPYYNPNLTLEHEDFSIQD